MIVKNISKKVIGNTDFRLLPGDTREVSGNELWVLTYLEEKKLTKVDEAVDPEHTAGDVEGEDGNTDPPTTNKPPATNGKKKSEKTTNPEA